MVALRRRVLSAVLVTGSPFGTGIGANLPDDVEHRRPFAQDDRVVAVEPARAVRLIDLGKFAVLWASTETSPFATEPVRLIVSPAVPLPLKNIWTL